MDACRPIWRKIIGYDEPYFFFGERCKDMFRVDVDRWFRNARVLRRWLKKLQASGKLSFLPHVVCWICDDKRPGIWNPHLYFLLPEGSAVWNNTAHHRLLKQVASQLTEALGGDLGGLSNLFMGKNPLSPHCDYEIINDESFPTLSEYAKSMKLKHGAKAMARKLGVGRLAEVGFDAAKSNTYFSKIACAGREAVKQLFRSGFRCDDYHEFLKATAEIVSEVMAAEIPKATWKQREAIEKLVESCSRWAVDHFDPAKMDTSGRDVGAAAHLIDPTDDKATRQGKGGAYAAKTVAERNCAKVAVAIRKALIAGGPEPTFTQIVEATGFSLNTVKKHWFPAFTQASASLSIQSLVKGVSPQLPPSKPTLQTLRTAETVAEIPEAWRSVDLDDHFRVKALRETRRRRIKNQSTEPIRPRIITGKRLIDFVACGAVQVFRSAVSVIRFTSDPSIDAQQAESGAQTGLTGP
jgi:hypothetical protein